MTSFLKTERKAWADKVCDLLAARGVQHSRREERVSVRVATDAPDDDYGKRSTTMYFVDADEAAVKSMRLAKKAKPPNLMLVQAEVDAHVLAVYASAI